MYQKTYEKPSLERLGDVSEVTQIVKIQPAADEQNNTFYERIDAENTPPDGFPS